MPEYDVKFERTIYADVTIVAEDAESAAAIAVSPDYELPPEDHWTVASGGEISVRDEAGEVLAEETWAVARIIPPAALSDRPLTEARNALRISEDPTVPEIPAGEFRIMLFAESTVVGLPAMPAYELEAAGEVIIPAEDPALKSDLPLLLRARDGSEFPARVLPSALEGKTWIALGDSEPEGSPE